MQLRNVQENSSKLILMSDNIVVSTSLQNASTFTRILQLAYYKCF